MPELVDQRILVTDGAGFMGSRLVDDLHADNDVRDPVDTESMTVDDTLEVVEAARETDARVVLASSAAISGEPESVPISETARMGPSSPYGIHKLSLDHDARAYHVLYDLHTVALRDFTVYEPAQTGGAYAGVIEGVQRIFKEQVREGDVDRSFADVSRARQQLGYDPTVSLEGGRRATHPAVRKRDPSDSSRSRRRSAATTPTRSGRNSCLSNTHVAE